jgi:hypothetical protein
LCGSLFYLLFSFQEKIEPVLLVDQGTSQLEQSLNEDCLPYADTKKVEVLKDYINWQGTAKAVNNNTVIKTEKDMNKEFENVDDPLIKNEMEKHISQEHVLHQNGVDINVKCEVKDEIVIEEHEICVEDTQDVR